MDAFRRLKGGEDLHDLRTNGAHWAIRMLGRLETSPSLARSLLGVDQLLLEEPIWWETPFEKPERVSVLWDKKG